MPNAFSLPGYSPQMLQMLSESTPFGVPQFEIYNSNWVLQEMTPIFVDFRWRRRFSRPGEFQLTVPYTVEQFNLYLPEQPPRHGRPRVPGNIIYNRGTNEAAFITSRHKIKTINNRELIIVRGHFAAIILNRRVVTLEGRFTHPVLLQNVINNNFLTGAISARRMANLRLLPISIPATSIWINARQRHADTVIIETLEDHSVGVRVDWNFAARMYEILFYRPMESETTFSHEFANVAEQEYWEDVSQYKNVVLVGDSFTHGTVTGMDRREVAISAPAQGTQTNLEAAREALQANRAVQVITSVISAASPQFIYMEDWGLGSIVTLENRDLDFRIREIVTEVTEFYDLSGRNIEINTSEIRG